MMRAAMVGVIGTAVVGCASAPESAPAQVGMTVEPVLRMQANRLTPEQAYQFGREALAAGRVEVALQWFEQAVALDPALVDGLNGKVVAMARLGRAQAAIAIAEDAQRRGLFSAELGHNIDLLRARAEAGAAAANAVSKSAPALESPAAELPRVEPVQRLRWAAVSPYVLQLVPVESVADVPVAPIAPIAAAAPSVPAMSAVQSASPADPKAQVRAHPARIEVSNGAGALGLARRHSVELKAAGADVRRVTNHPNFNVAYTEIRYRGPAQLAAARATAGLFPATAKLVQDPGVTAGVDVRIVLGRDAMGASAPLLARATSAAVAVATVQSAAAATVAVATRLRD